MSDIVIRTPGLDAGEIAAVTAVLTAITRSADTAEPTITPAAPDAWSRSQRAIRKPLQPGAGHWRAFEG
ncbi:acyl-CoA carboxylase subunit epsilon [Microbacteriaceae bacterium VKM Ac-2855]|nr:acyl-CoA carboxylase subunit epsilon [Microbacteriaceae bacterium VKM Ac-2855]